MKVLVVEDDEDSRLMLCAALDARGHAVVTADNGVEAIYAARLESPDIIVSDILMPRMDGFDLCRILKNDERMAQVPFVFYTATYTDSRDESLARALGADEFLVKPMEIPRLLDAIEAIAAREPHPPGEEVVGADGGLTRMHVATLTRKLEKKIEDLENANAALRASEERFQQLADNIDECFWMTDASGRELVYASAAFERIWGFPIAERAGDSTRWRSSIHPDDRERVGGSFFERARKGPVEETYRIVRPGGSVVWIRERGFPVHDGDGAVYRIAGISEDVTEAQVLSEQLNYQATHDALTGLANRRVFEQRLERVLRDAQGGSSVHALCYLDLDQFKVINDTCGHIEGDRLLREVASVLDAKVRRRDTLARLGGDEFGLLLEHCTLDQAMRVAESIREALDAYRLRWGGTAFRVSASLGLVPIDGSIEDATATMSAADAACYVAKEAGRNRIHVYRADDIDLARRYGEMRWVGRLNEALDCDRLRLFQQRIMPLSARAGNASHVEILLRFAETDGSLVTPDQFLPAAERYNLASRVDQWVVRRALDWLRDAGSWVDCCSINLSAHSLVEEGFLEFLVDAIDTSDVAARRLCLEVTETAAIANLGQAITLIESARSRGCRIALDDFGSGLSSFAYLKSLPVDFLKIDGTFVRDAARDPIDLAMVRSINDVGHVMDKQTIAECVESSEILACMREIGVDYVQGVAIAAPGPCEP